jgi:hypothetical protein
MAQVKSERRISVTDAAGVLLLILRWGLVLLSVVIFLVAFIYTTARYIETNYRFSGPARVVLNDIAYNDLTDGAIQTKLTLANTIFQVSVLVFAGLAGILVGKENEAKLVFGDVPEIIMLAIAGASLIASFVSYGLYVSEVSYLYQLGIKLQGPTPTIPDVFHLSVSYLSSFQLLFFLCGLVIAMFTFISTHTLRRK